MQLYKGRGVGSMISAAVNEQLGMRTTLQIFGFTGTLYPYTIYSSCPLLFSNIKNKYRPTGL